MQGDLRPYSVVDNEGFRQLLNECEPRYTIPTRRFITETAVPQLYADVKHQVTEAISSANRAAITCDAWTSRATQSYVTLTGHHSSPVMAIFISMYNDKRTQMCILVEQRGSKCLSVSNLF